MKHKELKFIAVFISFILVISILPLPFAKIDVASAQTQRPAYACATLNEPILSVSCLESSCIQTYDTFAGQLSTYFNGNPPSPLQGQYDNRDQCVAALRTFLTEVQSRNIFTSSGGSSVTVDRSRSPLGTSAQTCNDQCFARTSVNSGAGGNIGGAVPIGICSTQELAVAAGGFSNALSGAGTNVGVGATGQTFTLGKGLQYGCQVNEWCICQRFGVAFNVNNQANNQQGTTGLQGFNTASVPGTRGFLLDPADVTDTASKKPANDVICSQVSRVTLEADINPKLVPTGTQLTITGAVTKFSSTCNGVQYECRMQYNAGCHVDAGFFKTCIIPNDCSPDVEIPGGKRGPICTTNWMRIIGLALMVVAVATIVFSAAIAAALSTTLGTTVSQGAVALSGLSTATSAGSLIATPTQTPGGGTGTQEGASYPFLQSTSNALDVQRDPGTGEVRSYRDPGTGEVVIVGTNYQGTAGTTQTLNFEKLQEATCAALFAIDTATTPAKQTEECQRATAILRKKLEGKDINDQTVVNNAISETLAEVAGARDSQPPASQGGSFDFNVGDRIVLFDKTYERAGDGLWHLVGSDEEDYLLPTRHDTFVKYAIQQGDAKLLRLDTSLSVTGKVIAESFGSAEFPLAYAQDFPQDEPTPFDPTLVDPTSQFPSSGGSGGSGVGGCPPGFVGSADDLITGCKPISSGGEAPLQTGSQPGPCTVQNVCPVNTVPSTEIKNIDGNNCPIITCKPKTGTTTESAIKTAGLIGTQVGLAMFAQSTPLPQGGCYNICGKNIGRTPVAASPVCPGYPVSSTEKTFKCGEQSCGGFEGKDVNIQIKTQEGRVLNTATVTTDANGAFSYTFTAPSTEAVFIAVVTTEGSASTVATTAGTP